MNISGFFLKLTPLILLLIFTSCSDDEGAPEVKPCTTNEECIVGGWDVFRIANGSEQADGIIVFNLNGDIRNGTTTGQFFSTTIDSVQVQDFIWSVVNNNVILVYEANGNADSRNFAIESSSTNEFVLTRQESNNMFIRLKLVRKV